MPDTCVTKGCTSAARRMIRTYVKPGPASEAGGSRRRPRAACADGRIRQDAEARVRPHQVQDARGKGREGGGEHLYAAYTGTYASREAVIWDGGEKTRQYAMWLVT